jgi:UDP:flavonoid glycosyltransferase YjiC (YdhE family)
MGRCLIFTWSGAGNQSPAIGLAQGLAREGHRVIFAGSADQRGLLEGRGFAFRPLSPAGAPHASAFETHRDNAWANPAHFDDLARLVALERPDVLVIDCLMFGALAAAERTGQPATVLVHSAPNALVPASGSLEAFLIGPVNRLRAGLGLAPLGGLQAAWAPFRSLCASLPELDPPGLSNGANVEFVGPMFEDEPAGDERPPWGAADARPLVLVSFSTGKAWDQRSRIERTAAALADQPVRAIFTTGLADVGAIPPPPNARFTPSAPHRRILAGARATVTHGGHGTVMASLAAGVPLVCLPNPGVDQEALAARVEALGAGLALDGEHATAHEIRAAVEAVVLEPAFAARAAELAARIRGSAVTSWADVLLLPEAR